MWRNILLQYESCPWQTIIISSNPMAFVCRVIKKPAFNTIQVFKSRSPYHDDAAVIASHGIKTDHWYLAVFILVVKFPRKTILQ